ncbi:MAG: hypothetical protein JJE17_13200 [Peptostreptococcaceae bacterium]|nr:hypothetical protein [Peptostreptococcaceae bacterium]
MYEDVFQRIEELEKANLLENEGYDILSSEFPNIEQALEYLNFEKKIRYIKFGNFPKMVTMWNRSKKE